MKWISECARILKASGTLYVCGFSEILADLKDHLCSILRGAAGWSGTMTTKPISEKTGAEATKAYCV